MRGFFGGLLPEADPRDRIASILVITVEEIQSRVAARLPRAQPLPGRPQLDKLIKSLSLEMEWKSAAASGRGDYVMAGGEGNSIHASESLTSRQRTRISPAAVPGVVPPEITEANAIEDKLKFAANNGAYLAISVPPGFESKARIELERRFMVEVCDLDATFITTMRQQAAAAGADWNVVIQADAAAQDSADWKNLQMLVERCLPDISGLWVLVPADDTASRPSLNHRAIPLGNDAQHVRLNKAWLANKHRA